MAPDRSKAGRNRNRLGVFIDDRVIPRVHLQRHGISTKENVIAEIGKTPGLVPDGTISTAKIADLAVTADKIANTTITAAQLADTAITGGKLANTTITDTQLANDAVTTAKINAGAVTTTELGADAVDGTKIADDAIGSEHIADDAVVAAAIADDAVGSAQIADGAVDTARLGADAVTSAKIADDAVGSEHIADDAVVAAAIADDAVGSAQIADGAVDTARLGADAVTGAKLADDAVGSEHIADDAVVAAAIADGAVDAARLATNAVSTVKIADDAVTEAKLADTHVLRADRQVGNPYASQQTTSLTQYYSFTIPGGTLANRTVRVHAHGTMKNNSGSTQNFQHVVRLAGVDMHEAAGSIPDDADQIVWIMRLDLSYRASGAQFLSGEWRVSQASTSSDGISNVFGMQRDGTWGNNAVAESDDGDLALTFLQRWQTSRTNSEFKVYAINVEYV